MGPFEEPVANRLYDTTFDGLGADKTADKIGITLLAATAIGVAAHAVLSMTIKDKEQH